MRKLCIFLLEVKGEAPSWVICAGKPRAPLPSLHFPSFIPWIQIQLSLMRIFWDWIFAKSWIWSSCFGLCCVIISCPSCLKCRVGQCGDGTIHYLPWIVGFQTPPWRFCGISSIHFVSDIMKCSTGGIYAGRIWKKGILRGRMSWFFIFWIFCGSSIPSGVNMGSAGFSLKI